MGGKWLIQPELWNIFAQKMCPAEAAPPAARNGGSMLRIVINLGALAGLSAFWAVRFRSSLTETLPAALCSIGIVLYGLAFFQKLHWITAILALCLLLLALLFLREARRRGLRAALRLACGPLRETQFWVIAAAVTAVILLVGYRQVLEWDAYSFWASDIKSLFYRNGFAERQSNVASAYGDYPPNLQLMIWWFLHMCGRFDEGLLFGGYFLYSGLLLFSLTGRLHLKGTVRQVIAGAAAAALLFALPSVVDTSWYRALYVDPVMAILWGCLLCTIALEHRCTEGFWYFKCLVLLAAMTLTKSIGFLWGLYAVVFYLVWHGFGKKQLVRAGGMAAAVAAGCIPWNLYCRLLERTTYLTDSIGPSVGNRVQEILQGTFFSSGNNLAYIKSYIKAFLFESVHRARTWAVDLTPALVMLLVFGVFLMFYRVRWLSRGQFLRLAGFALGVYGLTYCILLCSHLTIFYNESQYLQTANMLTQMTRYGAPMNLGFLLLGAAVCMERLELPPQKGAYARAVLPGLAALTVLLCAGYSTMADCLIAGHDPLNPQRLEKRALFLDSYGDFLEEIAQVPLDGEGQRVLLLYSSAEYNPIVTFFASPVSVQTARYYEGMAPETLWSIVDRAGASWVYVQDGTEAELALLDSILDGCRVQTLYPLSRWRSG